MPPKNNARIFKRKYIFKLESEDNIALSSHSNHMVGYSYLIKSRNHFMWGIWEITKNKDEKNKRN